MSGRITLPFTGYAYLQSGFKGVFVGDEQIDQDEPLVAVVGIRTKNQVKFLKNIVNIGPAVDAVLAAYAHDTSDTMNALRAAVKAVTDAVDAADAEDAAAAPVPPVDGAT